MSKLNTTSVAELLGSTVGNVNYYINQGYLKAKLQDNHYVIEWADYNTFRKEYFDTNKRNFQRGRSKKLSEPQVTMLPFIVSDLHNDELDYHHFIKKYNTQNTPFLNDFVLYKRNRCIVIDKEQNSMKCAEIADKYNVSSRTVEEVLKQKREEVDLLNYEQPNV